MTIEERLGNMERELSRLKRRGRWLLGAVLLVAGGLVIPLVLETTAFRVRAQPAGAANEIRAKSFVLEDENGKGRAWLDLSEDGPRLSLYGENGKSGAKLVARNDGPRLSLYGENGKTRAWLAVTKDGPSVVLGDEDGNARAVLVMTKEGPKLMLTDENDKVRAGLEVSKDGPSLDLFDEKGVRRFAAGRALTGTPDGKTITYPESSLILFGPDGKVIWSAIK